MIISFVARTHFLSCTILKKQLVLSVGKVFRRPVRFFNPLPLAVAVSFLTLVLPFTGAGQSVAGLTGTVTDPNGAVLPNALVMILDTRTGSELRALTNEDGVYRFTNLRPGPVYRLSVSADNFQTLIVNNVTLGIDSTATRDVELKPGRVSETIEINALSDDVMLNTTDASIGNIIGTKDLRELPIQFRNSPAALIELQAGVVGANAFPANFNSMGSVAGSRADQGNITIDGIDANDQMYQEAFYTVGNAVIDSIQELRTVTVNPSAAEGRSSGGQIQMVTKSGSNDFHGSLREYYRTDKTAANRFFNNKFGLKRPALNRHQFGGSFGGPVPFLAFGRGGPRFKSGNDRLFFFFDYEGRRDNSERSVRRVVPLEHFRRGVVGYINNRPGCGPNSRLDTQPDCISFVSATQAAALDPKGIGPNRSLLDLINARFPLPNDFSGGDGVNTGGFRFNAPELRKENTFTARIDSNLSPAQRLFVRTTVTRRNSTAGEALFPGDADRTTFFDRSYSWAAGHGWIVSRTLFNQATVGISKSIQRYLVPPTPAFPNVFRFGNGLPEPFAALTSRDQMISTPTIRDDLTLTLAAHSVRFGGQFRPIRQKTALRDDFNYAMLGNGGMSQLPAELRPADILPDTAYRFDSDFATILGRYANITTHFNYRPDGTTYPLGTGRTRNYIYNEYELYFQDNWKIRRDLTLNLGLRWQFYPAPYEKDGFQAGNDLDFEEVWNLRLKNAAAGIGGPESAPFLSYSLNGKANGGPPLYKSDRNNFGPRLGFAYNPAFKSGILKAFFGQRKTVLRGGASILFDRIAGVMTFLQDQHTYIFDNSAVTGFSGFDPFASLSGDPRFTSLTELPVRNAAPAITLPFVPYASNGQGSGLLNFASNYAVARDFQTPYSYQWSFGIQRELPGDMLLDVSYVGRKGRKLLDQSNASQLVDFKDPVSGQMMLDAFNNLQAEIQQGVPLFSSTPQPWIENQVGSQMRKAWGIECQWIGVPSCTDAVRLFMDQMVRTGDTNFLLYLLNAFGILAPDVGIGSQFAVNTFITNRAASDYDGMLVSLQKRFTAGFKFDLNYTWSHAIDTNSSVASEFGLICDLRTPRACRGNADFDIRHQMTANGIWDIPFGRGHRLGSKVPVWIDAVAGGWSVAGILAIRSGLPVNSFYAPFFTSPPVLNGDTSAFAAKIHDQGGTIQYFADPAAAVGALRDPRHGEIGNRNIFRGPGFWNLDLAISKKWTMPWSEKHHLTFRAEAYNATNSNSFAEPDIYFQSSSFGRISSSASLPRTVQFGLRYDF